MENTKRKQEMIEVITEYKSTNVITGGKVFISAEDAKIILRDTAIIPTTPEKNEEMYANQQEPNVLCIEADKLNMLYHSRDILRQFAKAILYAPVNSDITLASIASKYL